MRGSGLDAIAAADRSFAAQAFLSGARAAYEMVVHAFAAGDSETLRSLMAPEAFANFDAAIRARAAAGHTMTTTVVSIDSAKIAGAQLDVPNAQISVRFASKLASVTHDRDGTVVDGSRDGGRRPYRPVDLRSRRPLARSQLAADGDPVGTPSDGDAPRLEPLGFGGIAGFYHDDLLSAFHCFERSARALVEGNRGARAARAPSRALIEAARAALAANPEDAAAARRFFEARFRPFRVVSEPAPGFLTGYYEPCVAGSLVETARFLLADPRPPSRPRELLRGRGAAGISRRRHGGEAAKRRPPRSV